jgi:hypothetical protein
MPFRLGDDIDDFCVKCKRLTNHSIVSLLNDDPAKVRCRTCYHEQIFRHEQAPPSKKELKRLELLNAAAAEGAAPPPEPEAVEEPPAKKATRKTKAK